MNPKRKQNRKWIAFITAIAMMVLLICPSTLSVSASAKTTGDYDKTVIGAIANNLGESEQKNTDPIVFVHGLFGWGNDELHGMNYWGGKGSIRDMLKEKGYTVYTPTIGPIASNWDRACELYAYLVGGTVDYGQAHSAKYGHARYGRSYPGVYRQLLTNNEDNSKKIHLIGHSMGGETSRVLAQLLVQGDKDERDAQQDKLSPLFEGNHNWVRSVTTIATPHDGSQYDEVGTWVDPLFHDAFALLAATTGKNNDKSGLDLKMDQWGLHQDGESYLDYYRKVMNSKIWGKTKDLSDYDLSLEGARDLNSWVKAQPGVYYFSIACSDSHKNKLTGHYIGNANINPIFYKSTLLMGSFTQKKKDKVKVTKDWWENDGIVSTRAAKAPHEVNEGCTPDAYRESNMTEGMQQFKTGTWNYLGVVTNTDHLEIVAQEKQPDVKELQDLYCNLAKVLHNL